ncbi:MAG: CHRD domain-containing protein [Leptolyngbyaceae cyanobacterium SL_5_9]|nr:CHRD domain-containing protein [Leptolyngbyaceae cyanobacterium SL_5_9]NJO75424.1 CHRD domain-containing protein [Leptolyngbyaceae cyanobacterium RM1_406_9]
MKQLWMVGLLSAGMAIAPQLAQAATFSYSVPLEAEQEVAPNVSTSSAMGTATGALVGDLTSWVFNYSVEYTGLEGPLADGHIHFGDRGTNGPVIHFLDNIDSFRGTTSGTIVGDYTSEDVIAAGMVTPDVVFNSFLAGGYYFNVHSETFPGGEIRGQIDSFEEVESVPEPTMVLGMLSIGALGVTSCLKKRQDEVKVS